MMVRMSRAGMILLGAWTATSRSTGLRSPRGDWAWATTEVGQSVAAEFSVFGLAGILYTEFRSTTRKSDALSTEVGDYLGDLLEGKLEVVVCLGLCWNCRDKPRLNLGVSAGQCGSRPCGRLVAELPQMSDRITLLMTQRDARVRTLASRKMAVELQFRTIARRF